MKNIETPDTASATATTTPKAAPKGLTRDQMLAHLAVQKVTLDLLVERGDVTKHEDGSYSTSL